MDIRQPVIAALVTEREALVVEPQAVEDRGVYVVDMHGVLDDVVTEIVGGAVAEAAANSAARQTPTVLRRTVTTA